MLRYGVLAIYIMFVLYHVILVVLLVSMAVTIDCFIHLFFNDLLLSIKLKILSIFIRLIVIIFLRLIIVPIFKDFHLNFLIDFTIHISVVSLKILILRPLDPLMSITLRIRILLIVSALIVCVILYLPLLIL